MSPLIDAPVTSAIAEPGAVFHGLPGKSGPTREEDTAYPEGSPATPGGRERNSPLMVPDGEPCSAADGPGALKEGDAVAADGDGSWF